MEDEDSQIDRGWQLPYGLPNVRHLEVYIKLERSPGGYSRYAWEDWQMPLIDCLEFYNEWPSAVVRQMNGLCTLKITIRVRNDLWPHEEEVVLLWRPELTDIPHLRHLYVVRMLPDAGAYKGVEESVMME